VTRSVLVSRVLLIALLVLAGSSMLVSQAGAAGPPTVATLAATSVTATSAVLHGTVNPNGVVTTWDFSNPPTTQIYCPSPAASLPGDNVAHPVSCTATGLTPSTYYEYIVRASSDGGNSFGSSVGFTTAAAGGPPTVVTMPATGVTATSAVLHATVNPNGLVTTWDFSNPPTTHIYCPSPGGNLPADSLVHAVSCTATGLTPSTYYEYIVRASNSAGNGFGLSVGFTTAAAAATDWALSSPTLSPASPNAGDAVTFRVILTALSSGQPYPQAVTIVAQLDGMTIASKSVTYPGPTGLGVDLYSTPPWTATAGTHTVVWQVTGAVPDPNPANNQVSSTFTVGPPPTPKDFRIDVNPASLTVAQGQVASYSINVVALNGFNSQVSLSVSGYPSGASGVLSVPSGTPDFSTTLTVTLPSNVQTGSFTLTITGTGGGLNRVANVVLIITIQTQTQTSTQTPTQMQTQAQTTITTTTATTTPESLQTILDMLQRNSLLVIGLFALVIIVLLALVLTRRKPSYQPPPPTKPCPTCGKSLTFVSQYDRWYCNNCQEYK